MTIDGTGTEILLRVWWSWCPASYEEKCEEISSEKAGARCFSRLDASLGSWQLRLDESSTKYCIFNSVSYHVVSPC